MTNVDRSLRARTALHTVRTRRFNAITAGVAMAFIAGLSGPTIAASASTPATTPAEHVALAAAHTAAHTGTPKPAAKVAKKAAAAPSAKQLHPLGIPGGQETFKPSNEQLKNVREIMRAGFKMHLPPRALVIAVATATQESTLHNIGNLGASNDHDSQGLFQQRPSSGWGTPEQITNAQYATTSFLKGLTNVDGWKSMPLTDAAQAVQVSAFPDDYAKWEKQAGDMVLAFYGSGPYAKQAANLK